MGGCSSWASPPKGHAQLRPPGPPPPRTGRELTPSGFAGETLTALRGRASPVPALAAAAGAVSNAWAVLPETFELFVSLRWVLGAALTPRRDIQPLPGFQVPPAVGPGGHQEVGETPAPRAPPPQRLVAHAVPPRGSPQLDGVARLVTAPLCPVPSSSTSRGCPGLPSPLAAPGGDLGLRQVGYGELHSGDMGFGDQGLRDTSYGDLHSGGMDLRELDFSTSTLETWNKVTWAPGTCS